MNLTGGGGGGREKEGLSEIQHKFNITHVNLYIFPRTGHPTSFGQRASYEIGWSGLTTVPVKIWGDLGLSRRKFGQSWRPSAVVLEWRQRSFTVMAASFADIVRQEKA
jgi:hypothetical protein